MCGIAGVWGRERERRAPALARLLEAQIHRGPDDAGMEHSQKHSIGMRRLAIIDLAGGHQPMRSGDGRWLIVLNGEIYNFEAVRELLGRAGHRFRTSSDTEVLLEAIAAWGVTAALAKIEGMFAFAALDVAKDELWLARDRFGEKPLYIDRRAGGFAFSSELSPLTKLRAPGDIDQDALATLLRLGYPAPGETLFAGIRELPPATWLCRSAEGTEKSGIYWQPPDRVDAETGDAQRCATRVRELLDQSVRARLVADVPLGLFLSGGIDSAAVGSAAVAANKEISAVTVVFGDGAADESELTAATAAHLGIHLHREDGDAGGFSVARFDELLDHYGQPFADTSAIPTRAVSRAGRKHFKVALSGDGGDEMFGGYLAHIRNAKLARFGANGWTAAAANLLAGAAPGSAGRALTLHASRFAGLLPYAMAGTFDDDQVMALLARERRAAANARFAQIKEECRHLWTTVQDSCLALSLFAVRYSLPQQILTKVDRMAMAESLEVRAPFLDSTLAAYALSLPADMKVSMRHGKVILRRALQERLPQPVIRAPKHGFDLPVRSWLGDGFWQALRAEVQHYDGGELDRESLAGQMAADHKASSKAENYRALHRAVLVYGFLRWRRRWYAHDSHRAMAEAHA